MNIYFDFEIDGIPLEHDLSIPTIFIFEQIKKFIEQRLSVLREEIEIEESKKDCYTLIILFPNQIGFPNYSEELSEKMQECFTKQDWYYLSNKIIEALKGYR